MLNIAICDDDKLFLEYMNKLIKNVIGDEHKISMYDNGYSLELYIEETVKGNLDILFIDIDLAMLNGIEIAKRLQMKYPHIKIVFVTGHIDYAKNIFESHPTYFLTKPIQKDKLILAINRAKQSIENDKRQTISFTAKGYVVNIMLNNIKYIESSRRIITVHESDADREVYGQLNEIERRLPENFLRCHQSYIVNMDRVRYLNMYYFLLNSGEQIPISQSQYNRAKKIFMKYLGDSL